MNIIKLKNKFKYAADDEYLETKVVISYICTLTTWFQKSMLNGGIPCIKKSKNTNLYKKSDVLKWVRENIQEINPTYNYTKTKRQSKTAAWLGKLIKHNNKTNEVQNV